MAFGRLVNPGVPSVEAGGPVLSALKNIYGTQQSGLQNQILNAQAQYAPQQAQANAFLTQQQAKWAPLQYQMQALSNPLLWLSAQSNPQLKETLSNLAANPLQNVGTDAFPQPAQQGGLLSGAGSILDKIKNVFMDKVLGSGQNQSQNSLQPDTGNAASSNNALMQQPGGNAQQGQGSPLVPATQGGIAGYTGKMTAPYTQSPFTQGTTIPDPFNAGQVISVPTGRQTTQLQQQVAAVTRNIPQMQKLPDLWKGFLDLQGTADVYGNKVGNYLHLAPDTLKTFGVNPNPHLPSDYAKAKLAAFTNVESYLKSIGVPVTVDVQHTLNKLIEPQFGESSKGYGDRIQGEVQNIVKDFLQPTLQQLRGGYSSAPQAYNQGGQQQAQPQQSAQQPAQKSTGNDKEHNNFAPARDGKYGVFDPNGIGGEIPKDVWDKNEKEFNKLGYIRA